MDDPVGGDDTMTAVRRRPARTSPWAAAIGALCGALLLTATAAAQDPTPAEQPPEEGAAESEHIDVRVRGGIGAGSGLLVLTGPQTVVQPVFHLSGRFGVQIGSIFSLYYQNMPAFVFLTDGSGTIVFDYNSALANLTLGNRFELGFGPSADVVALTGTTTGGSISGTVVLFGLHGRMAYNFLRESARKGPRRRGFSIGLETHPTLGPGGTLLTMQLGLGYEWY